jgi:hypothetical protein
MAIAHSMVEQIDNELVQIREHFQKAKSVMKREAIRKKLKNRETTFNGVYTNFKRAQDAATKSINHRRQTLNECLEKSKTTDTDLLSNFHYGYLT